MSLERVRGWWDRWAVEASLGLVALAWLYVFTYSVALNNPNERTRVLQTRAIVEYGQLHVGETFKDPRGKLLVRDLYGRVHGGQFVNDLALVCEDTSKEPPNCVGKLYPAKAPGSTLLGVPTLWAMKTLGQLKEGPVSEGRATWWLRWGGVTVWVLAGFWLVGWLLRRAGLTRQEAAKVILVGGFGTTLFCYGVMFVGHALAGACLIGGIWALERARTKIAAGEYNWKMWGWAKAAGVMTAWTVMAEYHAAVAVACVAGWVVVDRKLWRALPGFALGAGAVLAVFMWSHNAMYGHPLRTGHFFLMSAHNREGQSAGFLGIDRFHFQALVEVIFDPYMGILPLMPWLFLAAWVGVSKLLRRGDPLASGATQSAATQPQPESDATLSTLSKGAQRVLVLIPLVYLIFVSMLAQWRVMNGWSIGPRYLVPAMMPALVVAGIGWVRLVRQKPTRGALLTGMAVASVVVVSALTVVFPQPPAEIRNPFIELAWPLLKEGYGVRNLGMVFLGGATLKPFFVLVGVGLLVVLWPSNPNPLRDWKPTARALVLALGLCALWLGVMSRWPDTPNKDTIKWAQQLVRDTAEGWHPDQPRKFWPPGP